MKDEVLYEIREPKSIMEMTWKEVQEALKETDIVMLAAGAVEQHGPHNPLGTDSFSIYEVAKRVVSKLDSEGIKVVLAPLIPFGISPHHMPFPGTITLRPSTFKALVFDVGESMIKHGFKNVILLNGHGGNVHEVSMAALELAEKTDANVHFLKLPSHATAQKVAKTHKLGDHGGEAETSRMLVIVPKLVNMEEAKNNQNPEYDKIFEGYPANPADYLSLTAKHWAEITNQLGHRGDPTGATAETGDRILDELADFACDYIRSRFGKK